MAMSAVEPKVEAGRPLRPGPARSPLRSIFDSHEVLLAGIILAAGAVLSIASPHFLNRDNIHALFLGFSAESIVAIGMAILLVSGGFDLSVGSTMALTGTITAMALKAGIPVVACIPIGLAVGGAVGLANGLVIARVRINPFITTLGTMGIARGLLLVITGGDQIIDLPDSFNGIGQKTILGIQLPIIISVVLVLAFDALLRKSKFLRQNYYIGGNEKAAYLCGIPVDRMKIFNYTLMGLLAATAGIIYTARYGSTSATAGVGLELKVITAVVIGGASLTGGEGTILGAFLGALLIGLIADALTLLGVNVYWNDVVTGSALLVAVLIDTLNKRRKGLL